MWQAITAKKVNGYLALTWELIAVGHDNIIMLQVISKYRSNLNMEQILTGQHFQSYAWIFFKCV